MIKDREAKKQKLIKICNCGLNQAGLAKEVGINKSAVSQLLHEAGWAWNKEMGRYVFDENRVKVKKPRKLVQCALSEEETEKVVEMINNGEKLDTVSKEAHASITAIRTALRRYGYVCVERNGNRATKYVKSNGDR